MRTGRKVMKLIRKHKNRKHTDTTNILTAVSLSSPNCILIRQKKGDINLKLQKKKKKMRGCLLFSKKSPPEVSCVSFGDPERVPLELSSREDGFDFSQHVAKDQRQLGQVPPTEKGPKKRGNSW